MSSAFVARHSAPVLAVLLVVTATALAYVPAPAAATYWPIGPVTQPNLTLLEEAGQVIVAGRRFGEVDQAVHDVRDTGVGGVVFLGTPDGTVGATNALLRSVAPKVAPFLMTDQEGGRVQRLAPVIGSYPSARQLGNLGDPTAIRSIAAQEGTAMASLGFDMDLAPVADITWALDGVIGDRAFSGDAGAVAADAGAFADGLTDAGVIPVSKHFPGHGRASGDSHLGLVATPPLASLRAWDLLPFEDQLRRGVPAVMVGHLIVPGLTETDPSGLPIPTSISPATIDGLLRGELGFDGLVMTDSLGMQGVLQVTGTVEEAAIRSIAAGADLALLPPEADAASVRDAIANAVLTGRLPQAALDRAVRHTLAAKHRARPVGTLDRVVQGPGTVTVSGWAVDPDVVSPVAVHVYVDGQGIPVVADRPRGDLPPAFGAWGTSHGFVVDLTSTATTPGAHQVCAYAIDDGRAGNTTLGCTTVVFGNPIGWLDSAASGPGTIAVAGWVVDPDVATPITVHTYLDGRGVDARTADQPRADLAAALPAFGGGHGYRATVAAPPGRHQLCTYGINVGWGVNTLLGCRDVVVGGSPVGAVDEVTPGLQRVHVRGWAIDPDVAAPITVHLYADGIGVAAINANADRPDLGLVLPEYGPAHGIDVTVPLTGGVHQLCAYGINVAAGTNAVLGCRWVTVGGPPVGWLDSVTATPGLVHVQGWALDPDTAASIPVHAYLDGTGVAVITADGTRPDLAAALPDYGPAHGIDATIPVSAGTTHQLCLYGINTGYGTNALLGCRTITA